MADEQDVFRRVKEKVEAYTKDLLMDKPDEKEYLNVAYHYDLLGIIKVLKQINDTLMKINLNMTGINRNTR